MKPKFWIDCPICNVQMKQRGKDYSAWYFVCELCDTTTRIPYVHPKDASNTKRDKYRRDRLSERIIK